MNEDQLSKYQKQADKARYASYVAYAFIAVFTPLCMSMFEEHRFWIACGALFLAGPGLLMLSAYASPAPKKWQHHLETAVHAALFSWLIALFPSGVLSVVSLGVIIGIMVMQSHIAMDSLYANFPQYTISESLLCTVIVLITAVACGLEMALPNSGAALLAVPSLGYFLFWRSPAFYGLWSHLRLPDYQHKILWPRIFSISTPSAFWVEVVHYTSKFKDDTDTLLNTLTVLELLSFFDLDLAQYEESQEWIHPIQEGCKKIVNEKEPRALVAWNMHESEKDAAHYIQRLLTGQYSETTPTTLELPL